MSISNGQSATGSKQFAPGKYQSAIGKQQQGNKHSCCFIFKSSIMAIDRFQLLMSDCLL